MKNDFGNPALEKSFSFALRVVKLYQHLSEKKKEFVLSKQILRSGTSIGANLEESQGAQTPSDFQAKISIAYKEADCKELIRILGSTQLTMKTKLQKGPKS